jgi:hypothetical protein
MFDGIMNRSTMARGREGGWGMSSGMVQEIVEQMKKAARQSAYHILSYRSQQKIATETARNPGKGPRLARRIDFAVMLL